RGPRAARVATAVLRRLGPRVEHSLSRRPTKQKRRNAPHGATPIAALPHPARRLRGCDRRPDQTPAVPPMTRACRFDLAAHAVVGDVASNGRAAGERDRTTVVVDAAADAGGVAADGRVGE